MKKIIELVYGADGTPCVYVNNRYLIYLDDGCVYDTVAAKDIPQYVFKIRDEYMKDNVHLSKKALIKKYDKFILDKRRVL